MDYKIPTIAELPETLHAYLVESNEPSGPFGAKSVGELGINGVAAAIANAVAACDRRAPAPVAADRRARAARPARRARPLHEARRLSAAGAALGARRRRTRSASSRAAPASRAASSPTATTRIRRSTVYPAAAAQPATCSSSSTAAAGPAATRNGCAFMAPALHARRASPASPRATGSRPRHLFPVGLDDAADAVAWIHGVTSDRARRRSAPHLRRRPFGRRPLCRAARRDRRPGARARGLARRRRSRLPAGLGRLSLRRPSSGLSVRPRFLGPAGRSDASMPTPRRCTASRLRPARRSCIA